MSEQDKQVVREYYDRVMNGRDLDAVGDFFVDERLVEGVKGGCFRYFEAFPDLHIALDDLISEGDRVFVRSTMTGTHDGEYKGIPCDRAARRGRVGGGLSRRRREVRRLLVPDERGRSDAAAHRGSRGLHRLASIPERRNLMPKASKSTASEKVEVEGYEGHFEDFGPYTVGFETYTADADLAPLFVGLPDDRCQCPHMGYVVEGRVKFTFADGHEEVYEAGDAYYAPPGHLPTLYAGSQVIEFSPTTELQQTMAVVEKNMAGADA